MAGKHGFSLGKSYSQRIFQNFVAEKSSAFDLPPLLLLWKKCLRHNFSDFLKILNPASLKICGIFEAGQYNTNYTKLRKKAIFE